MDYILFNKELNMACNCEQMKNITSAAQYWKLYKLFETYISSNCSLLDWGSGNGHFSYFALRHGVNVTSYDFDIHEDNCKFLKNTFPNNYRFIQATSPIILPFDDNSFDMIVSVGTLEHVRENDGKEEDSLKEIMRILKPKGKFICYHFPKKHSFTEILAKFIKGKDQVHQFQFNKNDIFNLLKDVHMHLLEINCYFFLPRNILKNIHPKLANNLFFTNLYNLTDSILAFLFPYATEYFYFIVEKQCNG